MIFSLSTVLTTVVKNTRVLLIFGTWKGLFAVGRIAKKEKRFRKSHRFFRNQAAISCFFCRYFLERQDLKQNFKIEDLENVFFTTVVKTVERGIPKGQTKNLALRMWFSLSTVLTTVVKNTRVFLIFATWKRLLPEGRIAKKKAKFLNSGSRKRRFYHCR